MKASSVKMARIFGLVMIVLVGAWDVDAMRPHIAAHSWYTLALVALFLVAHVGDYLTVGRLIHRFDLLDLAQPAFFEVQMREIAEPAGQFSPAQTLVAIYERLFAYEPPLSLVSRQTTAKLYAFTIAEEESAQAVGAPSAMLPRYSVVPIE
jgi:hypothetical protein